ncbi:MAG TPA: hypothetical protein VML19_14755 [Verrucomicrobiae bacterium]|nr:hypothetical protein [Verrucomicrobiae bacterium]
MNNETQNSSLYRWLGRHDALDLVAKTCSAADVGCIKQIRDDKLYLDVAGNWDEFCEKELNVSRRKIDTMIRHLDELGPAYFELSRLTRVTAEEFRQLGPAVTADGIQVDGEVVEFKPENRDALEAAVAGVRKGRKSKKNFGDVLEACDALAARLEKPHAFPDALQKLDLAAVLLRMKKAAEALGVVTIEVRP